MSTPGNQTLINDALIDQLASDYFLYDSDERTEDRQYLQLPVKIYYFDGARIVEYAVTRDISTKGIGVITRRRIQPGSHIHIQLATLAGEMIDVPTKVTHCTAFGPFFHVGGYFIDRASTPPA